MEDWKSRLMKLHAQEHARDQSRSEEVERISQMKRDFLNDVAKPVLREIEESCKLIDRTGRLISHGETALALNVFRKDHPELTFKVEVHDERSVTVSTVAGLGQAEPIWNDTELVQRGETVVDITPERVRNPIVEDLEKMLRGEF